VQFFRLFINPEGAENNIPEVIVSSFEDAFLNHTRPHVSPSCTSVAIFFPAARFPLTPPHTDGAMFSFKQSTIWYSKAEAEEQLRVIAAAEESMSLGAELVYAYGGNLNPSGKPVAFSSEFGEMPNPVLPPRPELAGPPGKPAKPNTLAPDNGVPCMERSRTELQELPGGVVLVEQDGTTMLIEREAREQGEGGVPVIAIAVALAAAALLALGVVAAVVMQRRRRRRRHLKHFSTTHAGLPDASEDAATPSAHLQSAAQTSATLDALSGHDSRCSADGATKVRAAPHAWAHGGGACRRMRAQRGAAHCVRLELFLYDVRSFACRPCAPARCARGGREERAHPHTPCASCRSQAAKPRLRCTPRSPRPSRRCRARYRQSSTKISCSSSASWAAGASAPCTTVRTTHACSSCVRAQSRQLPHPVPNLCTALRRSSSCVQWERSTEQRAVLCHACTFAAACTSRSSRAALALAANAVHSAVESPP
jgi:hypothetical protein